VRHNEHRQGCELNDNRGAQADHGALNKPAAGGVEFVAHGDLRCMLARMTCSPTRLSFCDSGYLRQTLSV